MSDSKTEKTVEYAAEEKKRPSFFVDLFTRLIKEKPLGTIGGVIVLVLFFAGIFADLLAPYGYNEFILGERLGVPSPEHLLGCDNLGRDLLSRVIFGARISMYIGLGATTLAQFLCLGIGITSGYFGGKYDILMQRFVDAWMCLPPLFIYLSVMSLLGPGMWQVIVVLGVAEGIRQSRVVRSAVMGVKENIYIEAARAIGAPTGRILWKHIFPNVTAPQIILFTTGMGRNILNEATLSFLGFGIPPPIPSWGGMLSGAGRQYMILAPWMVLWPGLALSVVVYGINMLGDGIRDLLDPRLRGGLGRYSGVEKQRAKKTKRAGVAS